MTADRELVEQLDRLNGNVARLLRSAYFAPVDEPPFGVVFTPREGPARVVGRPSYLRPSGKDNCNEPLAGKFCDKAQGHRGKHRVRW